MYRYLPPLNAVRAFEAAARHQSFTRAAEELFVTQGAVSRQVRNLEQFLGAELFFRGPNSLLLTEAGQTLAPTVSQALESLDRCAEAVGAEQSILRVQVAPTFAVRWLMLRLPGFYELHKKIDVRITIALHPKAFEPQSFDAGIIYGDGAWPGLDATCLARECLAPVCAPSLRDGPTPILSHGDLDGHTLLHSSTDRRDWPWWLAAVGAGALPAYKGPAFETLDMAMRAAEIGQGVALGDLSLIADDIVAGRLVRPFGPGIHSGRGLYFVSLGETAGHRAIAAFRSWLLESAPVTSQPEKQVS